MKPIFLIQCVTQGRAITSSSFLRFISVWYWPVATILLILSLARFLPVLDFFPIPRSSCCHSKWPSIRTFTQSEACPRPFLHINGSYNVFSRSVFPNPRFSLLFALCYIQHYFSHSSEKSQIYVQEHVTSLVIIICLTLHLVFIDTCNYMPSPTKNIYL